TCSAATIILNVALPHIQGSLSASLDKIAWALTRWCGTERRSWRCAGRLRPLRSSSQRTLCWREMDSNFRFRARRNQEIQVSRRSSTDLVYGTVARISAEPSGRHAREQYRADKCPVDGEGPSREALEDAQKAPDRDKGRE